MGWPSKLADVLEKYNQLQNAGGKKLSESEKERFADEMIRAYDSLPFVEKIDVLVPANGRCLKDKAIEKMVLGLVEVNYYISYQWPDREEDAFGDTPEEITLEIGEQYDRLGPPNGKYMCPLLPGGVPQSVSARAVPYYIPEGDIRTSPAYHQYTVAKRHGRAEGTVVRRGSIAPVFESDPPDGGGTQVHLSRPVSDLIKGDVLDAR